MRPDNTQELQDLTKALRAGKADAWSRIYQLTHLPLLRLIQRLAGDPVKAEDLLQATYVTAIENLRSYDPAKGTIDAWLVGVAKFKVLESRRRPRHATLTTEPMQGLGLGEDLDREMIAMALDRLEPRHSEMLRRKYLDDQSMSEIAEALDMKEATVGTWLHRARAQFRAAYEQLLQKTDEPLPESVSPPSNNPGGPNGTSKKRKSTSSKSTPTISSSAPVGQKDAVG